MPTIAKQWNSIYQAGAQEMYRVNNPKRFIRLVKRLPVAYVVKSGMIHKGGSILEVGCGGGQYGIAFALCGFRTTLLDCSGETLRIAKSNVMTARALQPAIEAHVIQGDMFNCHCYQEVMIWSSMRGLLSTSHPVVKEFNV